MLFSLPPHPSFCWRHQKALVLVASYGKFVYFLGVFNLFLNNIAAYLFDIRLYLTPLGQARQFIETCGTWKRLCGRFFVYFWAHLSFVLAAKKSAFWLPNINEHLTSREYFHPFNWWPYVCMCVLSKYVMNNFIPFVYL